MAAKWLFDHFELIFWVAALITLFLLPVNKAASSLCVSSLLGLGHCPGCGIGHAIHDALHLGLKTSFSYHPMGIPAVIIIFMRIRQLSKPTNNPYEAQSH
jgi:hypothetical protein